MIIQKPGDVLVPSSPKPTENQSPQRFWALVCVCVKHDSRGGGGWFSPVDPTQKNSSLFNKLNAKLNIQQYCAWNVALAPDFPGKNAALFQLNEGARQGEQPPPPPLNAPHPVQWQLPHALMSYRCCERRPTPADVCDPRRRFTRQAASCGLICTVFNAKFSFYQPAVIIHRKRHRRRAGCRAAAALLLLLWPCCCCSRYLLYWPPESGITAKIPLRWTWTGGWTTSFCRLWISPTSLPTGFVSD